MNDMKTGTAANANLDVSKRFSLDTNGFDALKLAAKNDPKAAAKAAAKQFDAVFLSMMLKSMREATPSDGMLDSQASKDFTSMLDSQLAQQLSSKGVGLADMMARQLTRSMGGDAAGTGGTSTEGAGLAVGGLSRQGVQAYSAAARGATGVSGAQRLDNAHAFGTAGDTSIKANSSSARANAFIERLAPAAQAASDATGIPAHYILSQVALESGWGKREIRNADGSGSHNVLGVKAGADWKGPTVSAVTTEYVNGRAHKVTERFRAYGSYHEALSDYAAVLKNNSRYQPVLKAAANASEFAHGLQKAGYATDPQYGKKLLSIIKQMTA